MQTIQLKELLVNNNCTKLYQGETAQIISLQNGKILKIFDPVCLSLLKMTTANLEQKILASEKISLPKEFIKPEIAVYDGINFIGYTMKKAQGIDYNTMDENLTIEERKDLQQYANIYAKLEKIIKSTPDVVYPDICTCDNIYVHDNNIQLIDYDGFQVKDKSTMTISTTLGTLAQYLTSKKYHSGQLFTKELDKKSLIMLYFISTFNVDLNKVGMINPYTNQPITLDDVFKLINLDDYDIMNKVWKLFQENKENEYLEEDVFRIAQDYEMEVIDLPQLRGTNMYIKKLVRK